ncbi:MotA/TolQ/ExbB proton channel family protein [Aurantivibrio infirmus]
MKMTIVKRCLSAAVISAFAVNAAIAQDQPKAQSLDELLNMVKENRILETREHQQREAEFRRQRANQRSELDKAIATRTAEERRSERLEQTYETQEIQVSELRDRLQERTGSLAELFGHLTSQAGDTRSVLEQSIVSAQPGLNNRDDFLTGLIEKMNSATQLPSIGEIEQLWYEMQREAVEGGRVVKFTAPVQTVGGEQIEQEVVRIGNYQLVSAAGNYLYMTSDGKIAELPRQPQGGVTGAAANLAASNSGFTRAGIDPTGSKGGSFLSKIINRPNLIEQWHQGGYIGYAITGLGAFAILLALFRILALSATSGKVSAQLRAKKANPNNPLGRVLKVAEDNPNADTESLELKLEEAILKERPSIESGLALLKVIYMIAPLMGLLGTVGGMIQTFQAITLYGAGDPGTMADGISSALVTTMEGLIVAIPTMLLYTVVYGRAKRILHVLDEQSAGIVAENAERK